MKIRPFTRRDEQAVIELWRRCDLLLPNYDPRKIIERKLKVDDPVGAIAVHGFNGAWGLIALGLFADGTYGDGLNNVAGTVKGLFYGDPSQFVAEIIGVIVNFVFVFALMYMFFKLLDKVIHLRVSEEIELEGLDASQVSVTAYPDFSIMKSHG